MPYSIQGMHASIASHSFGVRHSEFVDTSSPWSAIYFPKQCVHTEEFLR